jgi:autotransporter-associated beta strand protein
MVRNGTNPFTLNVADATGDDAADLTISGVIKDYNTSNFAGMLIVKTGAGTISLSGNNTHIGVININEGTLALDGNSSLNTGNGIVLNGGTLDMSAYTNSVGILTVSDDSSIVLGAGEIAFADSSALPGAGH